MRLNCLTYFPYRARYYVLRPHKFIAQCWRNLKMAWQRITTGISYYDRFDFDHYLLELLPYALRLMAKESPSYPGIEPLETPEKYADWLNSLADVFESVASDDEWDDRNEWTDEFEVAMDAVKTEETDNNGTVTVTWAANPDYNEVRQLYFERAKELNNERQRILEDAFSELAKHFFTLWY